MTDLQVLDDLRAKGATRITFHENGGIASVEFGHLATASAEDIQHQDTKKPSRRMSATGGLVPRAEPDSQ